MEEQEDTRDMKEEWKGTRGGGEKSRKVNQQQKPFTKSSHFIS